MFRVSAILAAGILLLFLAGCTSVIPPGGTVKPDFPDNPEMAEFIEETYHQPYSFLSNNCIHKSLRIARKAKELGMDAQLVACCSIERWDVLRGALAPGPHVYVLVEGKRVDVASDPETEKEHHPNNERVILFPVKLPW